MKDLPRVDIVTCLFVFAFVLFTGLWWGRFATLSCEGPEQNQTQERATPNETAKLHTMPVPQPHSQQGSEEASEGEVCLSYRSITHWLFDGKLTDWVIALFTIVLAWKTWGLHSATRGLQNAAIEQAEITNRLFIADQRPWISIEEITFVSDIKWSDDGGLVADIRFLVKNIGKTPAVNLWINSEIIAAPPEDTIRRQQDSGSNAYRHNKVGATVFPGKHYEMIANVKMGPESARASEEYWSAFAEDTENTKIRINWLMPELVGDVAYRSTFSSDVLHTGFIRAVRRISKTSPQNVISEDGGNIPIEELRLSWSLIDPVIK